MNIVKNQKWVTVLAMTVVLSSIGINAQAQSQGGCEPYNSNYCQNLRNAEAVYERQRREQAARQQQQYLRNLDHQNGNTQNSGPTYGGSIERREIRGGYQWTLD